MSGVCVCDTHRVPSTTAAILLYIVKSNPLIVKSNYCIVKSILTVYGEHYCISYDAVVASFAVLCSSVGSEANCDLCWRVIGKGSK